VRIALRPAARVDDGDGGLEVQRPLAAPALADLLQAKEEDGGKALLGGGSIGSAAHEQLVGLLERAVLVLDGGDLEAGVDTLQVRGREREQRAAHRRLLHRHRHEQRQELVDLVGHDRQRAADDERVVLQQELLARSAAVVQRQRRQLQARARRAVDLATDGGGDGGGRRGRGGGAAVRQRRWRRDPLTDEVEPAAVAADGLGFVALLPSGAGPSASQQPQLQHFTGNTHRSLQEAQPDRVRCTRLILQADLCGCRKASSLSLPALAAAAATSVRTGCGGGGGTPTASFFRGRPMGW